MHRTHSFAVFETASAITLWAVSFTFIKIALRDVSPVTLIVLRFGMGSLILVGVSAVRGDFAHLRWADLPRLALLGAVGVTLQQILQVSGQVYADAGVAAFLASTAPAFLVALAALFLREKLRAWQVLGVILATLGAGIVSTGGDWSALLQGRLENPGNLLVLLSSLVWALFTILNRYIVQDRPPVLVTTAMMAFGFLFTLPLFAAQGGWRELPWISPAGWGSILYLGILSTAIAYLLYGHALKLAPASRLAAVQNIEPLIAVAAAAAILSEPITAALLVGGAAIVAGVYLAERGAPRALPVPTSPANPP